MKAARALVVVVAVTLGGFTLGYAAGTADHPKSGGPTDSPWAATTTSGRATTTTVPVPSVPTVRCWTGDGWTRTSPNIAQSEHWLCKEVSRGTE